MWATFTLKMVWRFRKGDLFMIVRRCEGAGCIIFTVAPLQTWWILDCQVQTPPLTSTPLPACVSCLHIPLSLFSTPPPLSLYLSLADSAVPSPRSFLLPSFSSIMLVPKLITISIKIIVQNITYLSLPRSIPEELNNGAHLRTFLQDQPYRGLWYELLCCNNDIFECEWWWHIFHDNSPKYDISNIYFLLCVESEKNIQIPTVLRFDN